MNKNESNEIFTKKFVRILEKNLKKKRSFVQN